MNEKGDINSTRIADDDGAAKQRGFELEEQILSGSLHWLDNLFAVDELYELRNRKYKKHYSQAKLGETVGMSQTQVSECLKFVRGIKAFSLIVKHVREDLRQLASVSAAKKAFSDLVQRFQGLDSEKQDRVEQIRAIANTYKQWRSTLLNFPRREIDFASWLAKRKNIARLGKELGIQLEVKGTEIQVGQYRADLVALDLNSGKKVVVEIQLDSSDHVHLGKLLTYVSNLEASILVWIARAFETEHITVINWLNQNTSEQVAFYGVQLLGQLESGTAEDERWRFQVVCRPQAACEAKG